MINRAELMARAPDSGFSVEPEKARFLSAGRIRASSRWVMQSHVHTHWEFLYFVSGSARIDVPYGTLLPQAYNIVIYPPGLPHSERANPTDPQESLYLEIDVPGKCAYGSHLLLPDRNGDIGWLCKKIVSECETYGATPLAQLLTKAFLHLVDRAWETGVSVPHDMVDVAVQYLHNHYKRDISLSMLANVVHVSKSHLIHRFDDRLGISPLRYLQQIRIEAAKRLLLTDTMPVNEVARLVGFCDPLYFSRAFKRATGYSPSAFRKKGEEQPGP